MGLATGDPSPMWILTTRGFLSVVAHREEPGCVLVRARRREDLEALREQLPDLELREDRAADYRWRTTLTRESWAAALARLAGQIDYDNFKSAVARRQGAERAAPYGRVWAELRSLQGD